MFDVTFPEFTDQKYYDVHFKYVLNILKHLNCNITYERRDGFVVTINGKSFLMDYADSPMPFSSTLPVFKFHYDKEVPNVFPFPPVSFHDWKVYEQLLSWIQYNAKGAISFRQRAYGNAKVRRNIVRGILSNHFTNLRTEQIGQLEYLNEVSSTFLAVFVPGWSNHMLDRAQFQYMALGCCTISPRLPELLPFGRCLVPNEHYVLCKDDYSDVVELIRFYECCREACVEIGNNSKKLFQEVATPGRLGEWIKTKL